MNKTTQYLYNLDPKEFIDMTYVKALNYKLKAAKKLNIELSRVPFMDEDTDRLDAVAKAIKHNEALLDELK